MGGGLPLKLIEVVGKWRAAGISLTTILLLARIDNPNKIIYDSQPVHVQYDFIIIGAGSAGAVVASRLSEDIENSVLLLESGEDGTALTKIPILTALVFGSPEYDWSYRSQPSGDYCIGFEHGSCVLPRGRMLGGSSSVNGMMYIRGNRNDYDRWERLGNEGWGYADVLPYFIKSEDNQDPVIARSPFHGVGGPLPVSGPRFLTDLAAIWLEAARFLGYDIGDVNGSSQSRFMLHQTTTLYGERWSTARSYLTLASRRPNLNILVRSHVTRIHIDPATKEAQGVVFFKGGRRYYVSARKEIVLSAGAFNSPQLLKLSGVGPCEELLAHGIPCLQHIPGVGENMQSHFGLGDVEFITEKNHGLASVGNILRPTLLSDYFIKRRGPLATNLGIEGTAFVHTVFNNQSVYKDWPDIQLIFYPSQLAIDGGLLYKKFLGLNDRYWSSQLPFSFKSGYRIVPILLRPRSRGRVLLRSRNPFQKPLIKLNLFDHPSDLATLREGSRIADLIGNSPPFASVGARPKPVRNFYCDHLPPNSDQHWECRIRVFSETIYHDTSTCAMGPVSDPWAVVDNKLGVYGIAGLRVVDASVMPRIVSGNTNAPTIMIAEKASDIIKDYWVSESARYINRKTSPQSN